jgi:hypothetical protein
LKPVPGNIVDHSDHGTWLVSQIRHPRVPQAHIANQDTFAFYAGLKRRSNGALFFQHFAKSILRVLIPVTAARYNTEFQVKDIQGAVTGSRRK